MPWPLACLDAIDSDWSALGDVASLPNPFFEPWFLKPSLEQLDPGGHVMLGMLVAGQRLRGIMPLHHTNQHHARSLPNLSTWVHYNSFCGTPLVEAGYEANYWAGLLDWCDGNSRNSIFLHLPQQAGDGAVRAALIDVCERTGRKMRNVLSRRRALLRSGLSPEEYYTTSLSQKHRKELRRQRKRLAEAGELEVIRSRGDEGIERWIAEFLALEARGWKGQGGSALASIPANEALFRSALSRAAISGRLERLTLALDGRPVAMLATLIARHGAFSFKTAYDEDYARYSPGLQLQVENLQLLADPQLEWCDSCAAQDHAMIDRLWRDKRTVEWHTVAIGRGPRRLAGEVWAGIEAWKWSRRS